MGESCTKIGFFGLLYNIVLLYFSIFKKSIDEAYFIKYNYKCKGKLRHFFMQFSLNKKISDKTSQNKDFLPCMLKF